MTASPRSSVSSDLYAPSEPAQVKVHPQGGSSQGGLDQQSSDDLDVNFESSEHTDTVQELDPAGEDVLRPFSAATGPQINGILPKPERKRKRVQDMKIILVTENHRDIASESSMGNLPTSTPSRGPTNLGSSIQWQTGAPLDDPLRVKRPRINGTPKGSVQQPNLSCKPAGLPAALWRYIFCFVPPVFLGRLLLVNRAFNSYLTTSESILGPAMSLRSIVQPLTAEAIWIASRKRFAPGLPKPIHGLQELDMWRLLVGQHCQHCGHVGGGITSTPSESLWEGGPGASGVRIIWPFGLRCCSSCLQKVSMEEMDLYLSTECQSFLLQAIPHALVTMDHHYIGHSLIRNRIPPSSLSLTKRFYKPAIRDITGAFEDAKTLGKASAEEWIKGLASQGQQRLEDIIRWEQWESKGGLKKVNSRPHPKPSSAVALNNDRKAVLSKNNFNPDQSTTLSMANSARSDLPNSGAALPTDLPSLFGKTDMTQAQHSWRVGTNSPTGTIEEGQTPTHQPRLERNIRDVNGAKAARRAEIERRCAMLDPPLSSSLLDHMQSFQAAIQITQPMTDQAWHVLKPRLLAQRDDAVRKEKERVQQRVLLEEEYKQRRRQEAQLKETKESSDREWETFQNPVRNRLGTLADRVIESRWAGGRGLSKDNSPRFAADVLLNVRQHFYAETAREDEAAVASGETPIKDSSNGPPTRTLILENMKWVFDIKIKPLTDHFQRELFLCNGCDGNFKFYGFEGVIQHYAAKHTASLSMGNIVVHWRSEWPEYPPFNPDPSVARSAYYKVPTPANPVQNSDTKKLQGLALFSSANQSNQIEPPSNSDRQEGFQHSLDIYTGPSSGTTQEAYAPLPNPRHGVQPTYGVGAGYPTTFNDHISSTTSHALYTAKQSQMLIPYNSSYSSQQPFPAFVQGPPTSNPPSRFPVPSNSDYRNGQSLSYQTQFSNGFLPAHAPNAPGPVSDLYQRQMDDMAKHAKDVFASIGGVKDLPGSVRIYVVIQLTVSRFKASFSNEPSLSMFIDGLDHNSTMRPVRSVNGLGCKTCMDSGTGAKLFTLPHLVNHFRSMHVENPQMLGQPQVQDLDWKVDMIDLPDASIISRLVGAAGMNDSKLALISSVFHGLFPFPLPSLRGGINMGPLSSLKGESGSRVIGPSKSLEKPMSDSASHSVDHSKHQLPNRPCSGFRPPYPMSEPLETPGEDEYDPHRPALLGQVGKLEANLNGSHRYAKPLAMKHCQAFPSPQISESGGHTLPKTMTGERPILHGKETPSEAKDLDSRIHRAQTQTPKHPPSPESILTSHSRRSNGYTVDREGLYNHQDNTSQFATSVVYDSSNGRSLKNGGHRADADSPKNNRGHLSMQRVTNIAGEFSTSLTSNEGFNHAGLLQPLNDGTGHSSLASWKSRDVHPKRPQRYLEQGDSNNQWSSNASVVAERTAANPLNHWRTGISDLQDGGHNIESSVHYYDDYRPTSPHQNSLVTDSSLSARHESQHVPCQERQETDGNLLRRPRSGTCIFPGTRGSQYHPASESPIEVPADKALYCPRSPVEEDRGAAVFNMRSPLSLRRDRPQRIVSYEVLPQAHYDDYDDHGQREPHYQDRVQYIRLPLGYDEPVHSEAPTQYIMSRSVERLQPEYVPDYVHFRQTYRGEPIRERKDDLYYTS